MAKANSILARVGDSLVRRGVWSTLQICTKNLAEEFRWYVDRSFDRRFGTDTSGRIALDRLDISSPNAAEGVYYEATSASTFRYLIDHLCINWNAFEYVDVGSGKGRTLLLASHYPFKKIVGVEFARELHDIADRNVRIYNDTLQQCRNIELLCMDAVDYVFPTGPFVLFMFNPFEREIMKKVAGNLADCIQTNRQDVVLIYLNSLKRELFEELGCFPEVVTVRPPFDVSRKHQRPAIVLATRPGLIRAHR